MSDWWKKGNEDLPFFNNNFQNILQFYLFNCPVEIEKGKQCNGTLEYIQVSSRAVSLRGKGWKGSALNSLLANMKHTTSKQLTYKLCHTNENIENEVKNIEKHTVLSDKQFEMIAIKKRNDMSVTGSIFYYIRNAFAHGSFSIDNGIYYFESSKNKEVSAQIRVREQTLLYWMDLFNSSANSIKLSNKKQKNKKQPKSVA